MKYFKLAASVLAFLFVVSMANVSFAQFQSIQHAALTTPQSSPQSSSVRTIDEPLCFFQQADGTVTDLSQWCGVQNRSGGTAHTPSKTPYNSTVIQQFDSELYGPDN